MKHPLRRLPVPALALLLLACDDDTDASVDTTTTEDGSSSSGEACVEADLELPGDAFYPEGVATDGQVLFVGSIATGEIVRADPCTGVVETFVPAGTLPGAVGLRVDPARNLLWACASDSAQQTYPSIDAFDLDSGEHLASHGFDSPGLCNDLVLDDDGNVYATDSFGHRIFRVAAEDVLDDGAAETWLADPTFVVPPEQFGLNGIVWDAGSLWVGVYVDGRVFEIEVADDGSPGTVTLAGEPGTLAGPDGMLAHDGAVLVVEGLAARLSRLDLGDLSVTPLAEGFDFPTTVAVVGDTAWVAQGQFDHLYGIDPNPPSLPFLVRRVPLR